MTRQPCPSLPSLLASFLFATDEGRTQDLFQFPLPPHCCPNHPLTLSHHLTAHIQTTATRQTGKDTRTATARAAALAIFLLLLVLRRVALGRAVVHATLGAAVVLLLVGVAAAVVLLLLVGIAVVAAAGLALVGLWGVAGGGHFVGVGR